MIDRPRAVGIRIAVLAWLAMAALTLMPHPEQVAQAAATPVTCLLCGQFGTVDVFLNVLLFLPLGLGLALAGFSARRTVALCALTTLLIELLQMKAVPGRDASLSDLLSNTLGGAVGAFLAGRWRMFLQPTREQARHLALAWGLILIATWAGTAWALGLALPTGSRWYGGWAPEFDNFQRFLGRPLLITAGGQALLPGPTLDQHQVEDAINADPVLRFSAVLAAPPRGLAPIGAIVDGTHEEVMLVGQDGSDLVFRARMRAAILRLRAPEAFLPGGLAGGPGDTATASGGISGAAFELTATVNGHTLARRTPLNASWGWMLVSPAEARLTRLAAVTTAAWIAGLLGILAYWSLAAGGKGIAVVATTALLLLVGIPHAAGFDPAGASDWLAALAGVGLGAVAAGLAGGHHAEATHEEPL